VSSAHRASLRWRGSLGFAAVLDGTARLRTRTSASMRPRRSPREPRL